jgi:hypothetical protein
MKCEKIERAIQGELAVINKTLVVIKYMDNGIIIGKCFDYDN